MRDIVKDMKNEIGDRDCGCQTIIIKIGEKRTKNLLYILSIALIFGTIWFVYHYFEFLGIIYAIIIALIIVRVYCFFWCADMRPLPRSVAPCLLPPELLVPPRSGWPHPSTLGTLRTFSRSRRSDRGSVWVARVLCHPYLLYILNSEFIIRI